MRRIRSWAFGALALAAFPLVASPGCASTPTPAAVRSLQASDQMAFVCLGPPGSANVFHPLVDCTDQTAVALTDFGSNGVTPHLYALVTQTITGQVAMVDLSTTAGQAIDVDPATPGTNFYAIGTNPRGIVASPNGTAAFAVTAEIGRPAIYAFGMNDFRPCAVDSSKCSQPAPTISSWPSCGLPAPPGKVVMVADPAVGGQVRTSCGGQYQAPDMSSPRSIDAEGLGREKLIVELPTLGQLAVLDAQTILDGTPGSLAPCKIERTISLSTTAPAIVPDMPPPTNPACVNPAPKMSGLLGPFTSQPSDMALTPDAHGTQTLYVGDVSAPIIHVVDVTSPCMATEQAPLVAFSHAEPDRQVRVSALSVGPMLDDGKRYLYAVDLEALHGPSLMVYDVSDDSQSRAPLRNPNPKYNPLQPLDRIQFSSAPSSLQIVTRDAPQSSKMGMPTNGNAPFGTRCDPSTMCSGDCPGVIYRTKSDFTSGAGPITLRGTFAIAALSSGQLGVVDIDDFDSPCRGPGIPNGFTGAPIGVPGCDPNLAKEPPVISSFQGGSTTGEGTCGVFIPNEPRSANYVLSNTDVGRHFPGITAYPVETTIDGTVIDPKNPNGIATPRMRAVFPSSGAKLQPVFVNGDPIPFDTSTAPGGLANDPDGLKDAMAFNLEDPRVQVADQNWTVQFEGPLPGTDGRRGTLLLTSTQRELRDVGSFCNLGVQSQTEMRTILSMSVGDPNVKILGKDVDGLSAIYADRVSLTDPIADQTQGYWATAACSFQECETIFGDNTAPTTSRDIPIVEAYDDHLVLGDPPAGIDTTRCCFPTAVGYSIRPGHQWTVTGAINGFFHHVIPDPATGVCRNSCDPNLVRMNGRVLAPNPDPVCAPVKLDDNSPFAFVNPMFQFAIVDAAQPTRDDRFTFATEGSFVPLQYDLTMDTTRPIVEPRAIRYISSIDSFVISDGALEGLLVVPASLTGSVEQIF